MDAGSQFAAAQPATSIAGAVERGHRTPEAEAQIVAAREPPTDIEIAMQEVDAAIEHKARRLRACGHAIFVQGCASCEEEKAYAIRDGVGWARAVGSTPAAKMMGVHDAVVSGHMSRETARRILTTNHPEVTDPAERERLGLPPLEVDRRPGCFGTYGSNNGVPLSCSPLAGCGLRGRPWQRPATDSAERVRLGLAELDRHQVHGAQVADVDPVEDRVRALADLAAKAPPGFTGFARNTGDDEGPQPDPSTVLRGDDAMVLEAFGVACAELEQHAERTAELQQNYRASLEQVSRMAARRSREQR